MDNSKSREGRRGRGRRRNSRKEEIRELGHLSEESSMWSASVVDNEDTEGTGTVDKESFPNWRNGDESRPTFSLMSPALRRQLQTHKNILRLLNENNLVSTQINGQRILSIQPVRWSGPTPGIDCEIFVGRIPKTIYEDTLYPLFKVVGEIFQIRLMVDMSELTRGYCFIMYTNSKDAEKAIIQLDQHEILPGKKIRVLASVNKCKLYIGPLPWHITSEEVVRVIYASAWDIEFVSIYRFLNHDAAYAIVSFKSHRNAALARRKLRPERLFKCNEVHVEWARVDWNPSNVYEDRGIVDAKGVVQITRKNLQFKKASYSSVPKSISPISPPEDNKANLKTTSSSKSVQSPSTTRYSNMLTMSAALDFPFDPCDESSDTNSPTDKVHSSDEYLDAAKDQTHVKEPRKEDSFRNFDMWNSSLVSQLPCSSTSANNPKKHGFLSKALDVSGRSNWENDAGHTVCAFNAFPKAHQYPYDTNVSNYHKHGCKVFDERINHSQPIVTDIPYQLPLYPSYPEASYFMPQPPALSVMCQDPVYNHLMLNYYGKIPQVDQAGAPCLPTYQYNQLRANNESAVMDRVSVSARKGNDRRSRRSKTPTENDAASHSGISRIQDTPKRALKYAPRVLSESNAVSCVDTNDERLPRAILKQTPSRVLL